MYRSLVTIEQERARDGGSSGVDATKKKGKGGKKSAPRSIIQDTFQGEVEVRTVASDTATV